MRHAALKLLLFLGLSTAWIAGKGSVEDSLYLRRDWVLLTVTEGRVHHKTEAKYAVLLGAGMSASVIGTELAESLMDADAI